MDTVNTFTLRSHELGGQFTNKHFLNGMGHSGQNRSPQLYWENVPEGTKSLAITMHDLDAPTGSGFWHWVVFNLPADVREIPENAGDVRQRLLPEPAVQANSDI